MVKSKAVKRRPSKKSRSPRRRKSPGRPRKSKAVRRRSPGRPRKSKARRRSPGRPRKSKARRRSPGRSRKSSGKRRRSPVKRSRKKLSPSQRKGASRLRLMNSYVKQLKKSFPRMSHKTAQKKAGLYVRKMKGDPFWKKRGQLLPKSPKHRSKPLPPIPSRRAPRPGPLPKLPKLKTN